MNPNHFARIASTATVAATAFFAACAPKTSAPTSAELLERGRHIVEDVALCIDCHTPRLPSGEFDRANWLMGSALAFAPTVEMPWMPAAPGIAGLPGYTDEQAVVFLKTGERPSGQPVLPPMPAVRLSDDEARAVVAYLRNLTPSN